MTDQVQVRAARILAIDWIGSDAHTRSRVALLREYLRRAAWWFDRYPSGNWPFCDISALVGTTPRADSGLVDQVDSSLRRPEVSAVVRDTCVWALHFAAMRQAGERVDGDEELSDPYEPLLLMYERGGGFTLDGTGFVQVDFAAVPADSPQRYRDREPLESLRPRDLDRLDG